jgi:hypothetical protein
MMISFKGRNSDHVDCTLNSDSPVCCSNKTKKERVNVGSPHKKTRSKDKNKKEFSPF